MQLLRPEMERSPSRHSVSTGPGRVRWAAAIKPSGVARTGLWGSNWQVLLTARTAYAAKQRLIGAAADMSETEGLFHSALVCE